MLPRNTVANRLANHTVSVPCMSPHASGNCLVWTGSVSKYGYGKTVANGKHALTHRLAWRMRTAQYLLGCWFATNATIPHVAILIISFLEPIWKTSPTVMQREGRLGENHTGPSFIQSDCLVVERMRRH